MNLLNYFYNKLRVLSNNYQLDDLKEINSLLQIPRNTFKIALIDDQPILTIRKKLKKHGFDIRYFEDIDRIDKIAPYQIIICDIKGVGKSFGSSFEGGYLIKEIHSRYPLKYIILFSGQAFRPDRQVFFRLCDDAMDKNSDVSDWSSRLDNAIKSLANPIYVWEKARKLLTSNSIPVSKINKLESKYIKSIIQKNVGLFESGSKSIRLDYSDSVATIDAVGTYLSILIGLIALAKK